MPDWKDEIRRRLADLKLSPAREIEIAEELSQHMEDRFKELLSGGASKDEATRSAIAELSDSELLAQELRWVEREVEQEPVVFGARRRNMIADIWQDLRYGLRMMGRNPGFTMIAVLTLALGIGANTAIFSLVNGILLRPLPYPESGRLVRFTQSHRQRGLSFMNLSQANFAAYRDQNQVFETFAAYTNSGGNLTGAGEPERIQITNVTADFFKVLGVNPFIGRAFRPEEETPGKNSVCVLSYGFWQSRFGSDPDIVGKSLFLNDVSVQVVGIMPEGFNFPARRPAVALWSPLTLNPERTSPFFLRGIARLKPGVSASEAEAETTGILWNGARQNSQFAGSAEPPPSGSDLKTVVVPLKEAIVGETDTPLLVLLCAVGLVLLIGCANVTNLMLARAASRAKEIAVRLALGATTGRIVRQLLTESLLLALVGAIAGMVLAWLSARMLGRLPVEWIPRIEEVNVDGNVLAFTVTVALLTGLLFGIAPARQARRLGLETGLREGMRGSASARTRRMGNMLVVAQFALSLVLLVGAGLLLKSFQRLLAVDPGFQPENVLTMRLSLSNKKYTDSAQPIQFYESVVERVRGLPGIEAAGVVTGLPFSGDNDADGYVAEGREPPPGGVVPVTQFRIISSGYFQAIGLPLLSGRDFLNTDRVNAPPVAIVDETLARAYWPDGEVVGKRIRFGWSNNWMTIVGVVGAMKDNDLTDSPETHMYLSHAQWPLQAMNLPLRMNLAVRTAGDPTTVISAIRGEIRKLDADLPVYGVETMTEALGNTLKDQRLINMLLTAFAALALALAAVGIYGVMSLGVSNRIKEFGIRMALGARPGDVFRMVAGQGIVLALAGVAVGLGGAFALTRYLESLLFEVEPTDPTTFLVVTVLLFAVAVAACYAPARRATKVDPVVALSCE